MCSTTMVKSTGSGGSERVTRDHSSCVGASAKDFEMGIVDREAAEFGVMGGKSLRALECLKILVKM